MEHVGKDKLRVLMVLGNTGRGGAQAYAINVLRTIDHERYHIDFVVNYCPPDGYDEEIREYGGNIHIVPRFKGYNTLTYVKAWNRVLGAGCYDIVHGHVSSTAFIYLRIAKKYSCATIAHSHSAGYRGNSIVKMIKRLLTPGAKKYADYWFSCSELAAIRMFGKNYKNYAKHFLVPNGIITGKYVFDSAVRHRVRNELSIDEQTSLFGHVGTFTPPKNHRYIIEIFSEIRKHQNAKLILVGDGPLRKQIEFEAESYGIRDSVIFTGNVDNVSEYLMAMDAMIFPSLFEGLPLTLLEAQATGLFCVVSDTISRQVFLSEFVTSLSIKDDASIWAEKLISIPKIDRSIENSVVDRSQFNMKQSIVQLMQIYEQMKREVDSK